MADEPVTAWREPWSRRARRWARRNRTAVTAAAAAVLVALVGTAAVLAVQTRANADLKAANTDLAVANAKVTRANTELAASNERERARFALAQEAIRMFHTGVSEDLLLKQKEFGALRTKLLRGAQEFYRKLEGLLGGQADRDSRLALGRAYFEVGELTRQLDSMKDALAMHQRALALFEDLAREAPADAELRREVERSYAAIALLLSSLGQKAEALAATGRACAIAQDLAAADPADLGRRSELARVEHLHGDVSLRQLSSRRGAGCARAGAGDPGGPGPDQPLGRAASDSSSPRHATTWPCSWTRRAGGMRRWRSTTGRATWCEGLFRANPTDARIAHELVRTLGNMAIALDGAGRQNEALAAYDRAREVLGAMGDANPTLLSVTRDRAWIDTMTAGILIGTARDAEALPVLERARKARETLVKADTSVIRDQTQLIRIHCQIAGIHARAGRTSEALASSRTGGGGRDRGSPTLTPATSASSPQLAAAYLDIADLLLHDRQAFGSAAVVRQGAGDPAQDGRGRTVRSSRYYLADGLRRRGIMLQKCGRPAEAVSAFREAIAILEGLAEPDIRSTSTTSPATNRCSPASPPMPAPVSRPPTARPRRTRR